MKILHVEPKRYEQDIRDLLEKVAEVDYFELDTQQDLVQHASKKAYEAVFCRIGLAINEEFFDACPTIRWVVTPTTGLDHIDLKVAERRGITIVTLKGETEFLNSIQSTGEHTWMLLLSLIRNLQEAHKDILQGNWRREPFLANELNSSTLGILGCGRLGRMLCRYGLAFDMNVIANDIDPGAFELAPQEVRAVDLDTLLSESDYLSIHLPLNDETKGFFDQQCFDKMKPGAFLVNTARGELIDEVALLENLASEKIAGAALDVLVGDGRWDQGIPENHPLVNYAQTNSNLILTPHMGGYGRTSIRRTRLFITEKFLKLSKIESS
ncbi:hydroxyacid dehydrogenase [bacterium]|nr:hydroxyacid dehydrogenase [bacterium]